MTNCQLYLITPPRIDDISAFTRLLPEVLRVGQVAALQIRLKDYADADILSLASQMLPIAHKEGVAVLINDRPDLAAKIGADGAHIGQDDMPYSQARAILGPDRMIGVPCHDSRHLAMEAGEAGADYVAFGAFFKTATKSPKARATTELLGWWSEIFEIPCVAIGGIGVANCAELAKQGADFVAISSGIWAHEKGPIWAAQAIAEALLQDA